MIQRAACLLSVLLALPALGLPGAQREPPHPDRPPMPRPRAPEAPAPAPRAEIPRVPLRPAGSPPATTRVVVRFAPTVPLDEQERRVRAAGGRRLIPARFAGFSRVPVPRGADPEAVAARLRREDGVVWAEPDRPCRSFARSVHAAATFDDPLLPLQWHHTRIRLLETFDRNAPRGRNVIVAIVDTGVAFGDGGSFPSRRGVDLAGASFVPGFDFVDDDPLAHDEGSALDPDDPDSARFGHGTFAASQIVAVAGNGTGGIGIAPNVTIMPLRVLGLDGFGFFSDVAEAVDFAVAGGASVINLSLGGEEASTPVDEAIRRATDRGVLIVAAAGNEATEPEPPADVSFPARHPEVLAVGATDFFGNRAAYSNRGTGLDLMAPAGGNNELVDGNVRDGTLAASFVVQADGSNPSYGHFFATGTSFAAPQVAGVAALLASLGVRDGAGLRILLLETVTDRGARGFDTDFGLGELDALRAHLGVGFN